MMWQDLIAENQIPVMLDKNSHAEIINLPFFDKRVFSKKRLYHMNRECISGNCTNKRSVQR